MSGLKINVAKTEICTFHRRNMPVKEIKNQGVKITKKEQNECIGNRLRQHNEVEGASIKSNQ